MVDIISVKMKGYSTPEEAFASDPVYMDATVEVWDQSRQVNVSPDGVYNLSINSNTFSFNGYTTSGSEQTLRITTDYDGSLGRGWTLTPDEVAKESVYFLRSDGTHCHYGDPAWPSSGAPGTYSFRIGMEDFPVTLENFHRTATLTLRAGRIVRQVTLTKTLVNAISGRITIQGTGDQAQLVLTEDPHDAGLYFRWGSVVGLSNAGGRNSPLPGVVTDNFSLDDIAFNPMETNTVTDWNSVPYASIPYTQSIPHDQASVKQGRGDPCGWSVIRLPRSGRTTSTTKPGGCRPRRKMPNLSGNCSGGQRWRERLLLQLAGHLGLSGRDLHALVWISGICRREKELFRFGTAILDGFGAAAGLGILMAL